jgi:hypothetical protein
MPSDRRPMPFSIHRIGSMETFFVKEGAHSPHTPGLARHRVAIAGDIAIKPGYTVIRTAIPNASVCGTSPSWKSRKGLAPRTV